MLHKLLLLLNQDLKVNRVGNHALGIAGQAIDSNQVLVLRSRRDVQNHKKFNQTIEKLYYEDDEVKNIVILPVIHEGTQTLLGVLEVINFRTIDNNGRAIIPSDTILFIKMLGKLASYILFKEKQDSNQIRQLQLRERISRFGIQIMKSSTIESLYNAISSCVLHIFNTNQVHLVVKNSNELLLTNTHGSNQSL